MMIEALLSASVSRNLESSRSAPAKGKLNKVDPVQMRNNIPVRVAVFLNNYFCPFYLIFVLTIKRTETTMIIMRNSNLPLLSSVYITLYV